ncbi:MAG: MBL fold metallo-hydrolase [Rhizobacter sp.]|nr:MBL fold metallo-hydrolase [Chlorobiales bacterium]
MSVSRTKPRWGRRLLFGLLGLLAFVAALIYVFGYLVFSAPVYAGKTSEHFNGEKFFTPEAASRGDEFQSFLKWQRERQPEAWPERIATKFGAPPPKRVGMGELRITFINHATTLIQTDSINILTDPIWSERCSPLAFAGPKRVRDAGIRFEDLPPIDAVVISHNHYDHCDVPTLQRLEVVHHPKFFVGLGNKAFLESQGISNSIERDWWQAFDTLGTVKFTCVPTKHFSARGLADRDKTLWCGFAIETSNGNIFFAGDTGYGSHFTEIGRRYGPLRLAILPIGAYKPEWFMSPVHVSPKEAVKAHQDLRAATSVAMHFGTFNLADEGPMTPVNDLEAALKQIEPRPQFWVLEFGEGRDVPQVSGETKYDELQLPLGITMITIDQLWQTLKRNYLKM